MVDQLDNCGVEAVKFLAVNADASAGWGAQLGDAASGGGFTGAGFANEGVCGAAGDGEADVVDGGEVPEFLD